MLYKYSATKLSQDCVGEESDEEDEEDEEDEKDEWSGCRGSENSCLTMRDASLAQAFEHAPRPGYSYAAPPWTLISTQLSNTSCIGKLPAR